MRTPHDLAAPGKKEAIAPPRRLLIILANTDPRNPEELGAPFYYAAVAAAMEHRVDVLCTATAGRLMLKGVAQAIRIKPDDTMTVYDWIKEAHGQGAKFWACPANLELFGKAEADLIAECQGVMGAAAMISDVMGDDCRVLSF